MIQGAMPVGLFLSFLAISVFQSAVAAGCVLFGVSLGMVIVGANVRTMALYR